MPSAPRVLVVQSGGRHNYAVPAAFAQAGMLEALYTDMCGTNGLGRLASSAARFPIRAVASSIRRLAGRRPPKDVAQRTRTDEWNALRLLLDERRATSADARRRALVTYNRRHGRCMARWGLGGATHLFNTFGEGGALVRLARDAGLPVLADIIIALSTDRIVWEEYEAFPGWGPPPVIPTAAPGRPGPVESLLRDTTTFVCPSSFVADDLVENWGVAREGTRLVPYALSDAWFEIEPDPVPGRVLFVGSADRRKGIHHLAAAADLLRARGRRYDFRVLGSVSDAVRSQPLARALDFRGRVPLGSIRPEFARADVFVLPSLAEGSAAVTYEAAAAGLPVVSTPNSGSMVRDGTDGLIVPIRDPDALADAVERIVEDRAMRAAMAKHAREHAFNYTWGRYSERLAALVN